MLAVNPQGEVVDGRHSYVMGHIMHLDSALHVGDSSVVITNSTYNGSYDHLYSTNKPLLINATGYFNPQPGKDTYINPQNGKVGIGWSGSYPANTKLIVRGGNSIFYGPVGITTTIYSAGSTAIPNGTMFQVAGGDVSLQGNVGVKTLPVSTASLSVSGQNQTAISIVSQQNGPGVYGIEERVDQPQTKALRLFNTSANQEFPYPLRGRGHSIWHSYL